MYVSSIINDKTKLFSELAIVLHQGGYTDKSSIHPPKYPTDERNDQKPIPSQPNAYVGNPFFSSSMRQRAKSKNPRRAKSKSKSGVSIQKTARKKPPSPRTKHHQKKNAHPRNQSTSKPSHQPRNAKSKPEPHQNIFLNQLALLV